MVESMSSPGSVNRVPLHHAPPIDADPVGLEIIRKD